jgi:hypothetical protein
MILVQNSQSSRVLLCRLDPLNMETSASVLEKCVCKTWIRIECLSVDHNLFLRQMFYWSAGYLSTLLTIHCMSGLVIVQPRFKDPCTSAQLWAHRNSIGLEWRQVPFLNAVGRRPHAGQSCWQFYGLYEATTPAQCFAAHFSPSRSYPTTLLHSSVWVKGCYVTYRRGQGTWSRGYIVVNSPFGYVIAQKFIRRFLISVMWQHMWDLGWTKWHSSRFSFGNFDISLPVISPTMIYTLLSFTSRFQILLPRNLVSSVSWNVN